MKRLILIACLLATPAMAEKASMRMTKTDIKVVDGDSIRHRKVLYRLEGIDTPELRGCGRARGLDAKKRVQDIIAAADAVTVYRVKARDKYGRALARVFVDQQNLADMLVEEGIAARYTGKGPRPNWC